MNAKKAREIIKDVWIGGDDEDYGHYCLAKGYLDALKGPEVKALVKALENFLKSENFLDAEEIVQNALAQFLEAVGEKK